MIDYANYAVSQSRNYDYAKDSVSSVSLAPLILSKRLIFLSIIFLFLILTNIIIALQSSMLNYDLIEKEKIIKNLQTEKAIIINKADFDKSANIILQKAYQLGLKPVNTKEIIFYK